MDWTEYLRFVAALGFVLSLMAIFGILLKRFGAGGKFISSTKEGRRLDIIEILPLDAKHRLYLLRRDNKEHLVIISENGETILESGITPTQINSDK